MLGHQLARRRQAERIVPILYKRHAVFPFQSLHGLSEGLTRYITAFSSLRIIQFSGKHSEISDLM